MKQLAKIDKKTFYKINEFVAKTSPMRTHYDSSNVIERWIWGRKKQIIKDLLSHTKYTNVLDLGCGDGGLYSLVEKDKKYTGIDISPTQLEAFKKTIGKSNKNKPQLLLGDISTLPFKESSFDLAFVCDVLEHVIDPSQVIREVQRVMRNKGYIIICIPNEPMLQIVRLITLRFPLRSPDHIYAIYPTDIKKQFPNIIKRVGIPFNLFLSELNLLNIFLVKNEGL